MTAPPGPIEPTKSFTIPRADATLHAEWFAPASKPRGLVVVTHGYAEHCGRYREVANVLVRAGAAVLTYDCRGHGKSSGKRGHIGRFSTYLDDLQGVIGWGRGQCAEAGVADPKLILLGHSHGSLITLRALSDRARADGAVAAALASPFLALKMPVNPVKLNVGRLVAKVYPALEMANELRVQDLTSDEGKQAERRSDTLCNDVATAGWFVQATQAQAYVQAHAQDIAVPTLWLVGGADPIADPARSREVADKIRGGTVEYHDLVGLKHEVFNEKDRPRVFELLTRFVETQLG